MNIADGASFIILVVSAAVAAATASAEPVPHAAPLVAYEPQTFDPQRDLPDVIQRSEAIVRSHLKDPDSARFEWPYALTYSKKSGAWWTCARVNARNSLGGYGEPSWFNVVVKEGQIIQLHTDEEAPWMRGNCLSAIRKGELQPRV